MSRSVRLNIVGASSTQQQNIHYMGGYGIRAISLREALISGRSKWLETKRGVFKRGFDQNLEPLSYIE